MLTTGALSGDTSQPDELGVIELHWMKEPDIAMHADLGVAVPALCGVWMRPDEPLAAQITAGQTTIRYVSCSACDLLHHLGTDALTA